MSFTILSGSNLNLSEKISDIIKIPLCSRTINNFKNGEIHVSIHESIRNKDVFLIQTNGYNQNINDMLMELLIMIDACKRSAARSICVIMPCYPYARQDKKEESREPITAKLIANLLCAAGMTRLIVMDLHAAQIQGFFDVPVDNVYSIKLVKNYLESSLFKTLTQSQREDKYVIISPDAGATKRTLKFAKVLKLDTIIMHKQRNYKKANTIDNIMIIGDATQYKGKTGLICDDMIDTAGTLIAAINALVEAGIKEVICVATHGILSGPALERINNCDALRWVIVSDSIDQTENCLKCSKLKVFTIGNLMRDAINSIVTNNSLSELFL